MTGHDVPSDPLSVVRRLPMPPLDPWTAEKIRQTASAMHTMHTSQARPAAQLQRLYGWAEPVLVGALGVVCLGWAVVRAIAPLH